MARHYVLLDRDGTINADMHYLSHPDQLVILPGAIEGLQQLQMMGFGLIVITNQSGIARGYFNAAKVTMVHTRLVAMLAAQAITLDGIYVCPHGPDDDCVCRKPRTGLVDQARNDHAFNPATSYVVGDKLTDMTLGQAIGAITIMIHTDDSNHGMVTEQKRTAGASFSASTLAEAATLIRKLSYHLFL